MGDRRLDRWFLRFRERGDPKALARVFDRTAPELLRVARHLLGDEVDAEDAVQATFLAAIQGARGYDPERPLLPWLLGVLARQAALIRRREARAVEAHRLGIREPEPPDREALSAELSAELERALGELGTVDREVLLPLLLHGRRPVQIARELGLAPATVRQRVHRGLARLRELLPAGLALGAALRLSPRGLAAVRAEVLRNASTAAATTAVAAGGAGLVWIGGSVMSTKVLGTAAACALALTGAWLAWPRGEQAGPQAEVRAPVSPPAPVASEERLASPAAVGERRSELPAPELETPPPEPAAVELARTVSGRLLGWRAGEDQPARVRVSLLDGSGQPPVVSATAALDGTFELAVETLFEEAREAGVTELRIVADHGSYLSGEVAVPLRGRPDPFAENSRELIVELELRPAAVVTGQVELAEPIAAGTRTFVALFDLAGRGEAPVDRVQLEGSGDYHLRAPDAGAHVVVALADGYEPLAETVELLPGLRSEVATLQLGRGLSIRGQVRFGSRPAEAGTRVYGWRAGQGTRSLGLGPLVGSVHWNEEVCQLSQPWTVTREDGSFELSGLSPDGYQLWVDHVAGLQVIGSPRVVRRSVRAPAEGVVLEVPFSILRLELTSAGRPFDRTLAEGCRVYISPPGAERAHFWSGVSARGRLNGLLGPGEELRIVVQSSTHRQTTLDLVAPPAGEELHQVVDLEPLGDEGRLVLRLEGPRADEVRSLGLGLFDSLDRETLWPRSRREVPRGADGFVVDDLPPGRYGVALHTDGSYDVFTGSHLEAWLEVEVEPGQSLERLVALELGGRLALSVRAPDGRRLTPGFRLLDARGERVSTWLDCRGAGGERSMSNGELGEWGESATWRPLRAGAYTLELSLSGYRSMTLPVSVVAGETARYELELEPE